MRHFVCILMMTLVAAFPLRVSAQERLPLFHTVDERDGLVSDIIYCLEADDYGYIWIGTPSGLCRYDGQKFSLLSASPENVENIVVGNSILGIKKDKKGRIWIATEKGVTFYDMKTTKFTFVPTQTSDGHTHNSYQADKMMVSSTGDVYFYSSFIQLYRFSETDTLFKPMHPDFFGNGNIRFAHLDDFDNLWLISEINRKIYKMGPSGDILREVDCSNYASQNPCKGNFAFLDFGNGEVWFGGDYGILIYDQNSDKLHSIDAVNSDILPRTSIKSLYKDKHNLVWIGTNAQELFVYNPETKYITLVPSSVNSSPYRLNSSTVTQVLEDQRGLMWFATWKGLSYREINPLKKFHNISSEEAEILPGRNYIMSFYPHPHDDYMAIGSDGGGITLWNKNSPRYLKVFDPRVSSDTKMETGSSLAVCYDHDGYLYNGGYNRSCTRIHPNLKDIDIYKVDPNSPTSIHSDFTTAIVCDKHNRVWFLTNGTGLYELVDKDKGIFKTHNFDKNGTPICSEWGSCLETCGDTILIGSYLGISLYDTKNDVFTSYVCNQDDTTSLSHNWISDFLVDTKGRIWVGTNYGLNLFEPSKGVFHHVGLSNGLLSEVINGILEDEATGMLWISTGKGLAKFNPSTMKVVRNYLTSDGLLSENFMIRSCGKDKDGTMFFGVSNGFTYFNPSEITDDKDIPMPTITGLMINYNRVTPLSKDSPLTKTCEATELIELDASQSTFTVEFSMLNYVNEKGNTYSYTLSGYNDSWVEIGSRHEITFTNLDPGSYVFRVKCRNADGCESDERPLRIIVHPPFYKTWWFVVMEVLVLVGFVGLYLVYRTSYLKKRQRQLEDTVNARTEALLDANLELQNQKNEMKSQAEELQEFSRQLVMKNQELTHSRAALARSNEEIKRSLKNILVLNDISRQITSSFDIENIILIAYNHVTQIASVDLFTVGMRSVGTNKLEFNYVFRDSAMSEPASLRFVDNQYAEVQSCLNGTEFLLGASECNGSYFRDSQGGAFSSVCVFPIHSAGSSNGVIVVACSGDSEYSNTDVANLRMVASYVSIAIDKARDYQQLISKNNAINGSIRYAKTIQDAILVGEAQINLHFDGAVLFWPKDIVSGDFYWFKTIGPDPAHPEKIFAAVVDCTGHGVPGAFMSMISNTLLSDIIVRNSNLDTAAILAQLDNEIKVALHQADTENNDGLDMAILRFDLDSDGEIVSAWYSGAKNPLYYCGADSDGFKAIAADRISIGGANNNSAKMFTTHRIEPKKGDIFIMCSDGIVDQNNRERKRYGRVRLMQLLNSNRGESMQQVRLSLDESLKQFMHGVEQRDDISLMALKIR